MPPKKTQPKDEDEINIDELLGEQKKKTKRELSEDQKNVLRERLVKMRETAKAKRDAKKAELVKCVTSDSNVSNDVFEKQYKDRFEMLDEKLTSISSDVSDMKKAKAEKARLRAEQKALADAEKEKVKEPIKPEEPKPQQTQQARAQPTQVPIVNMPEVKLSFRQRFERGFY